MPIGRNRTTVAALFSIGLLGVIGFGCHVRQSQSELLAKAKISQTEAQQIALARVPDGKVSEHELEIEHGKLVWSFDIATPGSKDITEVLVDAVSGEIVAVDHETQEQQAREAKEKQREKK